MTKLKMQSNSQLVYLGPPGAGLGFKLAGIAVKEVSEAIELIAKVKELRDQGIYKIIFIDEGIAKDVQSEIEKINSETIPAIVLLPNPANPLHLTQEKMSKLVMQAVGADIIND